MTQWLFNLRLSLARRLLGKNTPILANLKILGTLQLTGYAILKDVEVVNSIKTAIENGGDGDAIYIAMGDYFGVTNNDRLD